MGSFRAECSKGGFALKTNDAACADAERDNSIVAPISDALRSYADKAGEGCRAVQRLRWFDCGLRYFHNGEISPTVALLGIRV